MKRWLILTAILLSGASANAQQAALLGDPDRDGLPNWRDSCREVQYRAGFDVSACGPMDLDPSNDTDPECKARERVAAMMLNNGTFTTHVAFAVVKDGEVHFADAFEYLRGGAWANDPDGIDRLHRIGSTTKAVVATAAKVLEEQGLLSFADFVNDDDGRRIAGGGERTLRDLLTHQGAFKYDSGAIHLFCYPGDLPAFWQEPDDLVSPHYDTPPYGNLGGGYSYSAFNYSLAGTYLVHSTGQSFAALLQSTVFDATGMCTATLDSARAVATTIGAGYGISQSPMMHTGPYINLVSPTDPLCIDNFYSSDAVYGDPYTWQAYFLDEAGAEARDPAGGVIASVIDIANFAAALLASYHGRGGPLTSQGVRDLWTATHDLGCAPACPYESYYGVGFFTDSLTGTSVNQVGHGGSRAGYASALVLRPEDDSAVSILANSDVGTVVLSDLAKDILDDFQ